MLEMNPPASSPVGSPRRLVKSLSVIFPAYNEQQNIRDTVEAARVVLPKIAAQWEIIVVNDGSHDATTHICDELAAEGPGVVVLHHPCNKGYGAALKTGILAGKSDLVFFSDADGQFDLDELEEFVRWSKDFDIVAGYRKKRRDPWPRLLNAWGWNMLVRTLLHVHVRDIDCAFKLFRREVFEKVQIRAVGAMVNTEILAQAVHFGMRIHEVEVTHYPRMYGQSTGAKFRVILKAFRELFHLWWKLREIDHNQAGLYQRKACQEAGTAKPAARTITK